MLLHLIILIPLSLLLRSCAHGLLIVVTIIMVIVVNLTVIMIVVVPFSFAF